MLAAIALAVAVGVFLATWPVAPVAMVAPTLLLCAGFAMSYLRAYREARRLAPPPGAPLAVAAMDGAPEPNLAWGWSVLLSAAVAGVGAIAYTLARYDALPDRMPTHFGVARQPDGWSTKSVGAVMVLPIMTLVIGVTMGGAALLTARAKRGLRLDDGASLTAQNRYRAAMSRYLAI